MGGLRESVGVKEESGVPGIAWKRVQVGGTRDVVHVLIFGAILVQEVTAKWEVTRGVGKRLAQVSGAGRENAAPGREARWGYCHSINVVHTTGRVRKVGGAAGFVDDTANMVPGVGRK